MAKGDLNAAIEYARKNPQSDFARQLRARIESGAADEEARQLGIDLSWAGRPGLAEMEDRAAFGDNDIVVEPARIRDISSNFESIFKTIGKNTLTAAKEGLSKAKEGFKAGMEEEDLVEGIRTSGLPTAAGLARAAFSPVEGVIASGIEASPGAQKAIQKVAESKPVQAYQGWAEKNPELARDAGNIAEVAGVLGAPKAASVSANVVRRAGAKALDTGIDIAAEAGDVAKMGAAQATDAAKDALGRAGAAAKTGAQAVKGATIDPAKDYLTDKLVMSEIDPRMPTSAGRMPAKRPAQLYEEFLEAEKAYKTDPKAKMSLDIVGERAGEAFDDVIRMRKDAGEQMSESLKAVRNERTDLSETVSNLHKYLEENEGLYFDKGSLRETRTQVAMSRDDIALVEMYVKELARLGTNPTVGELDAFMKRIPSEMDVYKGRQGIMTTTNGERIIKNNLASLRQAFNPDVTGNEKLRPYYDARRRYSNLSSTIERAEPAFGKRDAEGNFTKDASLVKSAVNSLLNNGKREVLIELEDLTGRQLLDEAVIAGQAMKDMGNAQGQSLLNLLTREGIPMSKAGLLARGADWLSDKAADLALGDNPTRTKRFLDKTQKERIEKEAADFPRIPGLKPEHADLQEKSIAKFIENRDEMIDEYISLNKRTANADEARHLFEDVGYIGADTAPAVHEASAKLAEEAFAKMARENDGIFTNAYAGSAGAGKTSVTEDLFPASKTNTSAIMDATLASEGSLLKYIDATEKAGKLPRIFYTYRDPLDAWENGVLKRMVENKKEKRRIVPMSVFIKGLKGSMENAKRVAKEGKIPMFVADNTHGQGGAKAVDISTPEGMAWLESLSVPEGLEARLAEIVKKKYNEGVLSRDELEALMK